MRPSLPIRNLLLLPVVQPAYLDAPAVVSGTLLSASTPLMAVNYWFFVAGVSTLTLFIGYTTFATARLLKKWRPDRNLLLIPTENLVRLGLIILCLGLGRLSGLGRDQLGWQASGPFRQLIWGSLIGLGIGLFFYYTTYWLIRRTGQRFYSSLVIELIVPTTRRELILVLLAMLPVVLLEELLFRSLLLGGLVPIFPPTILLIGLSLLFGVLHSPQGVWGMVGAGLAGLFFGLLFLWWGSLLLPFVAHYVTNAFQIVQAKRAF
jgi:membrane protease YdiL (CAAX protease family)